MPRTLSPTMELDMALDDVIKKNKPKAKKKPTPKKKATPSKKATPKKTAPKKRSAVSCHVMMD